MMTIGPVFALSAALAAPASPDTSASLIPAAAEWAYSESLPFDLAWNGAALSITPKEVQQEVRDAVVGERNASPPPDLAAAGACEEMRLARGAAFTACAPPKWEEGLLMLQLPASAVGIELCP